MRKMTTLAKLSSASYLGLIALIATIPGKIHAQACYVELYAKNTDYVQVSVDTRGIETNVRLSSVSVEVSYRVGSNEAKKTLPFTDDTIRALHADKVYRRYFALNEGPDVKILGGKLFYHPGVGGDNYDVVLSEKNLSPGKPPNDASVIGSLPPSVGLPPSAFEFQSNISGDWRFTTHSDTSDETHSGSVTFRAKGSSVRGTMETWDQSNGTITGSYDATNGNLRLSRETGLETTQNYSLSRNGAIFLGKFWNEGKYSDSGTIELVRPTPRAPSGMGAEAH
jgi:hypothetical protein